MPLSGGPSDKLGNRYELWWTVSQFVRIINGELESGFDPFRWVPYIAKRTTKYTRREDLCITIVIQ